MPSRASLFAWLNHLCSHQLSSQWEESYPLSVPCRGFLVSVCQQYLLAGPVKSQRALVPAIPRPGQPLDQLLPAELAPLLTSSAAATLAALASAAVSDLPIMSPSSTSWRQLLHGVLGDGSADKVTGWLEILMAQEGKMADEQVASWLAVLGSIGQLSPRGRQACSQVRCLLQICS